MPTVKLADIKRDADDETPDDVPTSDQPATSEPEASSKAASIDYINNDIPITPRSTPQVLLLQQLLQKQQQQIVILQKLQNNGPTEGMAVVPTANTIALSPLSGSAGVVLTVHTKVILFLNSFLLSLPYHETILTLHHRVHHGTHLQRHAHALVALQAQTA